MGWSTGLLEQCLEELVLNWKGIFACLLCDGSEASWQGCPLCWEAPLDCPTPRVNRVRVSLLYPLQVCVLINTGITPSFALEGRHNLACLRGSADPFLRPPHHHTSRTAHGLLPKQPAVCFLATHIQVGLEIFFYHLCLHCKLFKTHVFWGCCLTSPWVCNSHLIFVDSIFMGLWADQTSSPCPKTPSLVHCADTGSVSHSFLEFPRGFQSLLLLLVVFVVEHAARILLRKSWSIWDNKKEEELICWTVVPHKPDRLLQSSGLTCNWIVTWKTSLQQVLVLPLHLSAAGSGTL